jgi:hypothetical protein
VLEQIRTARRFEYPAEIEVVEALVENAEGRPEKLNQIKAARAAVRERHPKP